MAILDLSAYRESFVEINEADHAQALVANSKPMEDGVHEVVLKEFRAMQNPHNLEHKAILVPAKDHRWVMFNPVFENAAGEQASMVVMAPLSGNTKYAGANGETNMPYKNLTEFLEAVGFDNCLENGKLTNNAFAEAICITDGEAINNFIGNHFQLTLSFNDKKVRPFYDQDARVWYIVDNSKRMVADKNGVLIESLQQPFVLDKEKKGVERWAEMALAAQRAGFTLQTQAEVKVSAHPTIKNDLSWLSPKKEEPKAKPALKAPSPLVARPPLAKVAPKSAPVAAEEIIEDAE